MMIDWRGRWLNIGLAVPSSVCWARMAQTAADDGNQAKCRERDTASPAWYGRQRMAGRGPFAALIIHTTAFAVGEAYRQPSTFLVNGYRGDDIEPAAKDGRQYLANDASATSRHRYFYGRAGAWAALLIWRRIWYRWR